MDITIGGLLALSTNLQPGTQFSPKMFELSTNKSHYVLGSQARVSLSASELS
jgi:hypothetical protein